MDLRVALVAVAIASAALGATPPPALHSGLDLASFDVARRPQDDLFRFVNGRWLETSAIPSDRVVSGTFTEMADRTEVAIRAILEDARSAPRRPGSPLQQIGDLYASFMDEARLNDVGTAPLSAELDRIDAIQTTSDLAAEAGYISVAFAGGIFNTTISVDAQDATKLIVQVGQGGTRMPSRDYYLGSDPSFVEARARYEAYLTTVLTLIGRDDAAEAARQVMAIETALARAQLSPLESRVGLRLIRRTTLEEMALAMPGFDWKAWARPLGFDRAASLVLLQPRFFRQFAALVPVMPLDGWKAWLATRFVFQMTAYLSRPFVEARFEFFGRFLSGQPEIAPRWKGGVAIANTHLGDAVGQIYVTEHFPPEARSRAQEIVATVIKAYRRTIEESTWLTTRTKQEATSKLARMTSRIGSPDRWRDYSRLVIKPDDLIGNWQRATVYGNGDRVSRIRGTNDAGGWLVNAQSMNAYYNPSLNEIVLTAAMLQPPVFDLEADDAVNYGALGATVGHEISHAFDERGRVYDATGRLGSWWTQDEEQEYIRRTHGLIAAFSRYSPAPGLDVNGDLTQPENVADLAGLSAAYRAYRLSLGDKRAPVIDGFTGDQRFFLGYARMWRMKVREDYLRQWLLSLQYAPEEFRTNETVSHLPAFHEAFGVTAGDRLYRAPADRVSPW